MKKYSLATLLLLTVVVALGLSHVLLWRQLSLARAEVRSVRRKFGYIRVDDASKIYVAQIAEFEGVGDAYRLRFPDGADYVLHVSDATFDSTQVDPPPNPVQTVGLYDWRSGADTVLSATVLWDGAAPRLVVQAKAGPSWEYVPPDWQGGAGPADWTWLQPEGQSEYSTDDQIRLFLWRNTKTDRGLLLWLEPRAKWQARLKQTAPPGL